MKKITILILALIIIFGGLYVYKNYIKYTPDYKEVHIILPESQKGVSLVYDANKWDASPYADEELYEKDVYDIRGIGLYHKKLKTNIGGKEKPISISFRYQFERDALKYCEEENTGGGCSPERPYKSVPKLNNTVIVTVDGQQLLVPTYNKEKDKEDSINRRFVYQIINGKLTHELTIGTRDENKQEYGEFFKINIDYIKDYDTWKKIEPDLIQIMKSLKIEKISDTTKTTG